MDSKSYLVLNSWLQKSDQNYIGGRILWFQMLQDQSCNLLWLASEQMIKILLLQKNIEGLSKVSKNLDEMNMDLNKRVKKRYGHRMDDLFRELENECKHLNLNKYKTSLEKINEFFHRRYVVNKNSSIPLYLIRTIDEFYFLLRNEVLPDVGLGTIDEIYIQRKHGWEHSIGSYEWAYKDNISFGARKHRSINYMTADGKQYTEDGSDARDTTEPESKK
jgi:hypothetical protein